MADWKMPEWMREIWDMSALVSIEEAEAILNKPVGNRVLFDTRICGYIAVLHRLRDDGVISTPTERDAKEKRIAELKAEVKRLTGLLADPIDVHPVPFGLHKEARDEG